MKSHPTKASNHLLDRLVAHADYGVNLDLGGTKVTARSVESQPAQDIRGYICGEYPSTTALETDLRQGRT
jgi:hypothetical protein